MHMVNNRNYAPLHDTSALAGNFPESLLPYVYMVNNRNFAPLNVLSSVGLSGLKFIKAQFHVG